MENNQQQAGTEVPGQSAGTSESASEGNEGSQEQQGQAGEQQGGEQGHTSLSPEAQKIVNNAIGRQHQKFREQETRANTLQAENDQLRAQTPTEQRPEIPPAPHPDDDDFVEKTQQREEAIRKDAEFGMRLEQSNRDAVENTNRQAQAQQQTYNELAVSYTDRAQKLGVDPATLQAAGQTLVSYGLPDATAQYLLGHEKGPLITQYLASNPGELAALSQMDSMSAAVRIATEIAPKIPTAPGNSGAPPPADGVGNAGAPPRARGPEGCTYE